jgi:hypothetical protein
LKSNDTNKALVYLNILNQQLAVLPNTNSSADQVVKILSNDATEALKNGDTNKALGHLKLIVKKVTTISEYVKAFLRDAIDSLQSNDSQGALVHLNWVNQQLETASTNVSSLNETTKVLLNDAIKAIQSGDFKGALVHLNLINQQSASNGTTINNNVTTSYCQGKKDEMMSRGSEWLRVWGTSTKDPNGLIRSDGKQLTSEIGLTLSKCDTSLNDHDKLTLTQEMDLINAEIDKNQQNYQSFSAGRTDTQKVTK